MLDYRQYFSRIGIPEDTPISHTEKFLSELQYNHVISVPYENLDILDGKRILLDTDALYEKIVLRRRGGYCFEVNALFRELLSVLSFDVKSYFARYWRGEPDTPLRRHHVLTVKTDDGLFVCDVGIGQIAPRYPLRLVPDLVQQQGNEFYKFEKDELFGWVLWELRHGVWQRYFSFTEDEALMKDFVQPSFYCEMHPDSPFNKDIIIAIKTPLGRRSLSGRCYKEFCENELILQLDNLDDDKLIEILNEKFGIVK